MFVEGEAKQRIEEGPILQVGEIDLTLCYMKQKVRICITNHVSVYVFM